MLFPQNNMFRSVLDCSGIWKFKPDPEKVGEGQEWYKGFDSQIEIAVPGSWNEQLEEVGLANYVGTAWYSTNMFIPETGAGRRIWLRIGSADYHARAWVNGQFVGQHQGGFLPAEFEITSAVTLGTRNSVTILVNNELTEETIPQGITSEDYLREDRLREETFPPARFDFFPYGGIHRPIIIHTKPPGHIEDIRIDTTIRRGKKALIRATVVIGDAEGSRVRCSIEGMPGQSLSESTVVNGAARLAMEIDSCRLWSPADPHLYVLNVELLNDGKVADRYNQSFGVREVKIADGKLLLNGEPIYLKGFGRHEDFAVLGKGLSLPLVVKDFGLLKWINANSFRTSHYPYAEEIMAMADRQGFLVIDEVPAVSLDMRATNGKTIAAHKSALRDLIGRDYNHPSVIMWALGNEPNLVGDEGYFQGTGRKYWEEIFTYARTLDTSRPMTVPNCLRGGTDDPVFEFSDVLTINRYYGWYEYPGRITHGVQMLEQEMEKIHDRFGKPMMMTEFGADAIAGMHSTSDQMFTEEYQAQFLEHYIMLLRSKDYVVGVHIWNFADFRTPQHFRRVVLNRKGVFTRSRQPKAAAFVLKKLWESPTRTPSACEDGRLPPSRVRRPPMDHGTE